MKLSRILSIGVVALTAFAAASPNATAHNPVKYTNTPFIVPFACIPPESSQFVSHRSTFIANIIADDNGLGASGIEIFTSVPTSTYPVYPPSPFGSFPSGNVTIQLVSPLPANVALPLQAFANWIDTPLGGAPNVIVSGNTITIQAQDPSGFGSNLTFLALNFGTNPGTGTANIQLTNFAINGTPLLFDTTVLNGCTP